MNLYINFFRLIIVTQIILNEFALFEFGTLQANKYQFGWYTGQLKRVK